MRNRRALLGMANDVIHVAACIALLQSRLVITIERVSEIKETKKSQGFVHVYTTVDTMDARAKTLERLNL